MSTNWTADKRSWAEVLLAVLSDGRWHHGSALYDHAGRRLGSRIHELRAQGYIIETKSHGSHGCLYRLTGKGPPIHKKVAVRLDIDDARALVAGTITEEAKAAVIAGVESYLASADGKEY